MQPVLCSCTPTNPFVRSVFSMYQILTSVQVCFFFFSRVPGATCGLVVANRRVSFFNQPRWTSFFQAPSFNLCVTAFYLVCLCLDTSPQCWGRVSFFRVPAAFCAFHAFQRGHEFWKHHRFFFISQGAFLILSMRSKFT